MTLDSPRFFGSNAGRSRQWNRAMVLRQLRAAGVAGRAQIARTSGLSTQAVSNIIAELAGEGLLRAVGERRGARGLPVTQYAIAPEGGFALGVDLRPGTLGAGLSDLAGRLLWHAQLPLRRGDPAEVAGLVAGLRARAVQTALPRPDEGAASESPLGLPPQGGAQPCEGAAAGTVASRFLGVGLVMPGPFGAAGPSDPETELPGWRDIRPAAWLEAQLGGTVLVENDANAAAVAERLSGRAQGVDDFLFLYFGSGLGLGIVAEGRLLRGARGNAGEIGQLGIAGSRLEELASRSALARRLASAGVPASSQAELAAAAGHPATLAWLDAAAPALSQAVALLGALFDPQTVLLGGALPDELLDALVARIAPPPGLPLARGASGRLAATRGAAALVVDRLLTPRLEDH